jgi:hypothetical protein
VALLNDRPPPAPEPGWQVFSQDGHLIGQVDAVFADYLLVRTAGLLPVDLYVPSDGIIAAANGRVVVGAAGDEVYARWHRPLKRVPHG